MQPRIFSSIAVFIVSLLISASLSAAPLNINIAYTNAGGGGAASTGVNNNPIFDPLYSIFVQRACPTPSASCPSPRPLVISVGITDPDNDKINLSIQYPDGGAPSGQDISVKKNVAGRYEAIFKIFGSQVANEVGYLILTATDTKGAQTRATVPVLTVDSLKPPAGIPLVPLQFGPLSPILIASPGKVLEFPVIVTNATQTATVNIVPAPNGASTVSPYAGSVITARVKFSPLPDQLGRFWPFTILTQDGSRVSLATILVMVLDSGSAVNVAPIFDPIELKLYTKFWATTQPCVWSTAQPGTWPTSQPGTWSTSTGQPLIVNIGATDINNKLMNLSVSGASFKDLKLTKNAPGRLEGTVTLNACPAVPSSSNINGEDWLKYTVTAGTWPSTSPSTWSTIAPPLSTVVTSQVLAVNTSTPPVPNPVIFNTFTPVTMVKVGANNPPINLVVTNTPPLGVAAPRLDLVGSLSSDGRLLITNDSNGFIAGNITLTPATSQAGTFDDLSVLAQLKTGSNWPTTQPLVRQTVGTTKAFVYSNISQVPRSILKASGVPVFIRGDANADGRVDNSDQIKILDWLFKGASAPPCMDAADANDDGGVDMSDSKYISGFLFLGSAAPKPPFPAMGADPTPDKNGVDIGCASYPPAN